MAELKEHVVDGIEEYDNPLPAWWLYGFYLSVLFAIGYAILYPSLWFWGGTKQWTATKQYEAAVAAAPKVEAAKVDLIAMAKDTTAVSQGQEIFKAYCVVCHGENAEGKIGPPLSPHKWRYGGDPDSILLTIRGGRPGGMPVWSKVLPDEKIQKVAAYVYTLSYGQTGPEWPPKGAESGAPAAAQAAPSAAPTGAPLVAPVPAPSTAPANASTAAPAGAPSMQPSGGPAASTSTTPSESGSVGAPPSGQSASAPAGPEAPR